MSGLSMVLFAAALLATGCVSGFLAGLLGVGGGIVVVPVLYMLFPALGVDEAVRMHVAVATSLAAIIPTAYTSARSHHKKGGLDPALLRSIGPAVFAGVLLGSLIGGKASGQVLVFVFAVIAALVSLYMAFKRDSWIVAEGLPASALIRLPIGLFIGVFSVLMGIGGGTLSVPMFSLFGVPIRRAVGTASAIGLIIGIPGAISFALAGLGQPNLPPFSLGYVNLVGLALIVPATILMAPVGVRVAHSIDPVLLRRSFAVFLCLTSIRMFVNLL